MTAYKSVQETNRTADPVVKLAAHEAGGRVRALDRKSTRLNSSHT